MRPEPDLARDLVIRSLELKLARLEDRVAALETWKQGSRKRRADRRAADAALARKVAPVLDRAARMNGCTVAEIVGAGGSRRARRARAEAAHDCGKLGLSLEVTGQVLGGRARAAVHALQQRHRDRLGIEG